MPPSNHGSRIWDDFRMDPFANAVFLFCGRKTNTMKALYFDHDGFAFIVTLKVMRNFFQ